MGGKRTDVPSEKVRRAMMLDVEEDGGRDGCYDGGDMG